MKEKIIYWSRDITVIGGISWALVMIITYIMALFNEGMIPVYIAPYGNWELWIEIPLFVIWLISLFISHHYWKKGYYIAHGEIV